MPNSETPSAQANQIRYELHSLGWKAFQDLSITIAQEIWRCPVQMFFDSNDGGRDGAFRIRDGETTREATIQCKFTAKANSHISISVLSDDFKKAQLLAEKGLCEEYILITNYHVRGVDEEKLKKKFEAIPGLQSFRAYGYEWVCNEIRNSSRLRMLVPRVYGLGDLSEILDERATMQANEILSSLGGDLDKFVMTSAFRKSAEALQEYNFVLLLGEPACGKSTIAATLSIGAIDEWKVRAFKPSGANDFKNNSNPRDERQLFWIDDAFGATQLDRQAVEDWNRCFTHVNAAIKRGARFVFTSRSYIFEAAKKYLKQTAIPIIKESQVVIKVEELTTKEKEQVLYNHIRLGDQTTDFRAGLKPFLPCLAAHKGFSPELARRLGNRVFTKNLKLEADELERFFAEPVSFLCDVIETLDAPNRAALALVFMRGGRIRSPVATTEQEEKNMELLGCSVGEARKALREIEGTLLVLVKIEGVHYWQFKHPTVRDAFSKLISSDPELLEIYLKGTPLQALFDEITCGSVDVEGNYVNISHTLYPSLLSKVGPEGNLSDRDRRSYRFFLSYRCDKRFLELVIKGNPDLIERLRVDPWNYWSNDSGLIATLKNYDLLPEHHRKRAAEEVVQHSLQYSDHSIISEDYRPLFTPSTYRRKAKSVLNSILERLDDTVGDIKDSYETGDPSDLFDELVLSLEEFKDFFKSSLNLRNAIERALVKIADTINEIETIEDESPNHTSLISDEESTDSEDSGRSIFDDVDAE